MRYPTHLRVAPLCTGESDRFLHLTTGRPFPVLMFLFIPIFPVHLRFHLLILHSYTRFFTPGPLVRR